MLTMNHEMKETISEIADALQTVDLLSTRLRQNLEESTQQAVDLEGWYNFEHRDSALGFLTPAVVHVGEAATVRAHRQHVLATAYAASRAVREGTTACRSAAGRVDQSAQPHIPR